MRTLFIVNDPPYGSERVYNALRLAHALETAVVELRPVVLSQLDPERVPGTHGHGVARSPSR